MSVFKWPGPFAAIIGTASLFFLATGYGFAEPVLNQVLSGARVIQSVGSSCPTIRIGFNFRVRYVSHFPVNGGRELRIKVRPLDRISARKNFLVPREAVNASNLPGVDIRGIDFEANGSGPVLMVYFNRQVAYKVSQGSDFTSILVQVAGSNASKQCRASLTLRPTTSTTPEVVFDKPGRIVPAPAQASSGVSKTDALMRDARAAIARKEYRLASRLLTKLINSPPHKYSAEAQELLGVVRERNGQFAHAKAEYDAYLKKYPKGEGAERVRQRLAAIATAEADPPRKLRKASAGVKPDRRKPARTAQLNAQRNSKGNIGTGRSISKSDKRRNDRFSMTPEERRKAEDPTAYKTRFYGSVSQYYYFNQGFTRFQEFESRRITKDDDIFQNSVLTSINLIGSAENNAYHFKWRFSGTHEGDFTEAYENRYRVSAAYAEMALKEYGTRFRIGRQTRHTGGILGRFDGGLFSWQINEKTTLNVVAGSPVDRTRDLPFLYDRYFYGASVDFKDIVGTLDMTLYAFEQRADALIDRRAVGVEFRYIDDKRSFFGSADYDFYFNRLNSALVSGSYIFSDNSTLSASADYVHSPSLNLTNALQGQAVDTLDALRNIYSVSLIKELALDRTTETMSANIAYSKPLNKMRQVTVDGTVFHTSGNPASGGVAAIESPGTEYFASAQLVGSGVFKPRGIFSATARYANTSSSNLYLFDTYLRYPFNRKWRLRPRIKVGYRELKRRGGSEIFAIPSLTTNYKFSKSTSFEVEVGGRISSRETTLGLENTKEVYVIGGIRYQF